MPRFLLIANPESRRVKLFQQALSRLGWEPAQLIAYGDLLRSRVQLDQVLRAGDVVRLESPGESFDVERELLGAGIQAAEEEGTPCISQRELDQLTWDRGLILSPRQWYLGFRTVLEQIDRHLGAVPTIRMNSPREIAVMFDKSACHALCRLGQVLVPTELPLVRSFDELLLRMGEARFQRVFLKMAHGSSASGVVAFSANKDQMRAVTSVELVRVGQSIRLYNSLRLRTYTQPADIATVINRLCRERVHVEQWLPKASLAGRPFDLRVVVIAGKSRHVVVRTSRSPITNLHLGNRRGDAQALQEALGPRRWRQMQSECERASALFPGSLQVALDVLLTPGFHRQALLEVNAFGDLLPGVTSKGHDTYEAQIVAITANT